MNEIPYGYCHCGCGEKTRIAERNHTTHGWIKGQPISFIYRHATTKGKKHSNEELRKMSESHKGEKNPKWNGGKTISEGYTKIRSLGHPRADSNNYVRENILIATKIFGKPIPDGAVVHHHPKNPSDQLVICQNHAYHMLLHQRQKALKACGHANWRKCHFCKKYDDPYNLIINDHVYHGTCSNKYALERRHLSPSTSCIRPTVLENLE